MKIWLLLILFLCASRVNSQNLDFSEYSLKEDIDYNSFYPFLVLKHSIDSFYKLPKNPVHTVSTSGWDSNDVADPFVHVTADSVYLYYDGSHDNHYSIGYATRDREGWLWENRKQILKSDNTRWRSYHIIAPSIV